MRQPVGTAGGALIIQLTHVAGALAPEAVGALVLHLAHVPGFVPTRTT